MFMVYLSKFVCRIMVEVRDDGAFKQISEEMFSLTSELNIDATEQPLASTSKELLHSFTSIRFKSVNWCLCICF